MWGWWGFLETHIPEHLLNGHRLCLLGDVRWALPSWDEGLKALYESLYFV